MGANWVQMKQNVDDFLSAQADKKKQEQEFQQALQMYLFKQQYEQQMGLEKARQEQQIKQQDPAYQMNQMRLAQALENMQKQAQFNKMAGMAYGNEPGQLNQPVTQMGGRTVPFRQTIQAQGTPALQFRRGFEQAGQTLVPSATGWSRVNQPKVLQPSRDKSNTLKIQLQKLAQQEAYRQMGGSMMVGLSEKKRTQYNDLVNKLYNSYLKQFGINNMDNMSIPAGNNRENIVNETNIMDTNW